jgi:nucleoid-associated protein YgaU
MVRTAKVLTILSLFAFAFGCNDKKKGTTTASAQDPASDPAYGSTDYPSGTYGPETASTGGSSSGYTASGSSYPSSGSGTTSYSSTETPTSYDAAADSVSASPPAAGGHHVVAKGESLYSIARLYYNDHHRWREIYNANKGAIRDPNHLKVGQSLVIP